MNHSSASGPSGSISHFAAFVNMSCTGDRRTLRHRDAARVAVRGAIALEIAIDDRHARAVTQRGPSARKSDDPRANHHDVSHFFVHCSGSCAVSRIVMTVMVESSAASITKYAGESGEPVALMSAMEIIGAKPPNTALAMP